VASQNLTPFESPVTCYPSWHRALAPLAQGAQVTVFSGCALNDAGNIACAPEKMRANAELQLKRLAPELFSGKLSLEAYTLARYMQSEVGSGTIEERVAVGEAAVNQAKQRPGKSILNVLLYNQGPGHPNYGFYGPIHGSDALCSTLINPRTGGLYDCTNKKNVCCAPFKRWASTRLDPTVLTLLLAELIMSGRSGNFARGADDQSDMFSRGAYPNPVGTLRDKAKSGTYWVGPLPGVNHQHTFLFRNYGVLPSSPQGAALLARGIAAVSSSTPPSWPEIMPICAPSTERGPGGEDSGSGVKSFFTAFAVIGGLAGLGWLTLHLVNIKAAKPMSGAASISTPQLEALRLAASRKSGLVSAGHSYPTSRNTLRALAKRGLVEFVGKSGAYYDMRLAYRITDAGRAAIIES
jgi:hypothetical protein